MTEIATASRRGPIRSWWSRQWQTPWSMILAWLAARGLVFGLWWVLDGVVQGDVVYYQTKISQVGQVGAEVTLIEYPTPVLWLLELPDLVSSGGLHRFNIAFVGGMLILDGVFALLLWFLGGSRRAQAVLAWIGFTMVLGPIVYMRFDLVPAVLAGAALLGLNNQRNRLAGVLTALGAGLKLWPALLWPATMVGTRTQRRRSTTWFFGTGVLLVVAAIAYAGFDRLFTPLRWQAGRGLQVESLWATLPMLARAFAPNQYGVATSAYQAYEIAGPGVDTWLLLANVSSVVGLVVIAGIYAIWFLRGERTLVEAGLITLLVITITIATNKTFSPQYMIWLGGPIAAMVATTGRDVAGADPTVWRQVRGMAFWLTGLNMLTFVVYPFTYRALVHGGSDLGWATAALVTRNLLLIAFLGWLFRITYGRLRPWLLNQPGLRHLTTQPRSIWQVSADEELEPDSKLPAN